MATGSSLEERMSHVEKDVAELKSQFDGLRSKGKWIDRITGTFRDDPEFDEILRLGQKIRRADRTDVE